MWFPSEENPLLLDPHLVMVRTKYYGVSRYPGETKASHNARYKAWSSNAHHLPEPEFQWWAKLLKTWFY